ncbi:flagellar hook-basal body complex protein FliE [Actinoplanes sp. TBRC 11911]|uniref:flagellar hook-basal body complex protein FliE n=1 Tax=Actinoplanes sp. TBRC 11911 TaxID=2729386 RepID=UPI00145CF811|nr:flagellar hook-basal body complex protein FliE [Actinoplanes sp. TBRC 11911]NMO50195.1 flagellar hook-basal body complex protein FliE [Actinoplanes sp. TBRC 11911]
MTSPISAISGFSGVKGVEGLDKIGGVGALTGTTPSTEPQGPDESFAGMLSRGLESVQGMQAKADTLAQKAADGSLQDPAQYTMAANEASLGLQLTLAVRNKAVEAFQEIMRMQA